MSPDRVNREGWAAIVNSGVRTLVDLRNEYEIGVVVDRPDTLTVKHRPVEDQTDGEFMAVRGERLGSPAYYPEILRRWPSLVSAAISAIADAPGAVLVHCAAGRDRTGMISAIVCQLVGVERSAILGNYEAAARAYNRWLIANPARERPKPAEELDAHLDVARAELSTFLTSTDVEGTMLAAGLNPHHVAAIRSRLLNP